MQASLRGIIFRVCQKAAIIFRVCMSKRKAHHLNVLQLGTWKRERLCVKKGARNKEHVFNVKAKGGQNSTPPVFGAVRLAQPPFALPENRPNPPAMPPPRHCRPGAAIAPALQRQSGPIPAAPKPRRAQPRPPRLADAMNGHPRSVKIISLPLQPCPKKGRHNPPSPPPAPFPSPAKSGPIRPVRQPSALASAARSAAARHAQPDPSGAPPATKREAACIPIWPFPAEQHGGTG